MPIVTDYTALLATTDNASYRWNAYTDVGTPSIITYSFTDGSNVPSIFESAFSVTGTSAFTLAQRQNFRDVVELYQAVAGVILVEVDEGGMIDLSNATGSQYGGWANYPITTQSYTSSGILVIDNSGNYDEGSYAFQTLLHEFGHSLGLKHPFEGSITLASWLDNQDQTVMTYNTSYPHTSSLGALDIQALRYLYGDAVDTTDWSISYDNLNSILSVTGGDANDIITGAGGVNHLNGGAGNDTIIGREANDTLIGGAGNDTINGGWGTDTIIFATDTASVSVAVEGNGLRINSAEGSDWIGNDVENFQFSDGTFSYAQIADLANYGSTITGTSGSDNLTGTAADDTINGLGGNDWITPGSGSDIIDGGAGSDMVSFYDHSQAVIVDFTLGTVRSGTDTNQISNVENITGSIFGDWIRGDDNNNRLRGLGDYDWFVGSGGNDTYEGGTGRDMVSYVYADARVVVDLGAGAGQQGQAAGDTYDSIERITGSIYSDLFYGSDGADDFRGLGGYDWFVGSGGGKDRYYGGSGKDTVSYAASDAGVIASILLGRGSAGDADRDLYFEIENLTGTNFNDELTGDNGRNILRGMYGEDRLFGLGGNDRMTGGGSDDYLDGGDGWDFAIFSGNQDEYTISTANGITTVDRILAGGEGTDTLVNIEEIIFADGSLFI